MVKPHYKVRLSGGFHEDREWWVTFARRFNGKAKILGRHTPYISTSINGEFWYYPWLRQCDQRTPQEASGPPACRTDWKCTSAYIKVLEMWAAQTWGHQWRDSTVVMVTDNETVRAALCSGRSRSMDVMHFVRRLF